MRRECSFPLLLALFLGSIAGAPGCSADAPSDDDAVEAESAVTADTSIADVDAAGRVSVRAGVLTLSFDSAGTFVDRAGARAFVITGHASRNLKEIHSFVPDDAFGETKLVDPRTFEITLRSAHEINTIFSGLPLGLQITTANGSPAHYEAAVHLGARFIPAGGDTHLSVVPAVRPVHAGTPDDSLRYRARVELTKTPDALAAADGTAIKRSARRYDLDWTYGAFANAADPPAEPVHFIASYGATKATTDARLDLRVVRLGVTTKTVEQAWPNKCESSVRSCIARAGAGATDLGDCGTYRQVQTCANEEPPPDASVTRATKAIKADVLAKTGITWQPAVLTVTPQGSRSIVLTALGRGGSAEWAIGPGTAISLERFVARPSFSDSSVSTRFEPQLRGPLGMPDARIIATGMTSGGLPLWDFVIDRGGVRSTIAVQATSGTTSMLVPYVYDLSAFRQMASELVVERAIAMASQDGIYGELEVYLNAMVKLGTSAGLENVATAADSPVGFTPSTETQLVVHRLLGDNAFFVTIKRSTGAIRVDDFN